MRARSDRPHARAGSMPASAVRTSALWRIAAVLAALPLAPCGGNAAKGGTIRARVAAEASIATQPSVEVQRSIAAPTSGATIPRLAATGVAERKPAADADPQAIARWVRELDDAAYAVRRRAEMELIRLGPPVLPKVEAACDSPSAEVRARARRIVAVVRHDQLAAGFRTIGKTRDDADIDLETGMILVSQLVDPQTDAASIRKQLDGWASRVRERLGDVDPRTANPETVVAAISQTLFGPDGFGRNEGNFDDPRNSALSHALLRRTGLPILQSHVAVAVGERLGVPLVGVALPYRYMFKYDGSKAPAGFSRADIIVDAYGGGRIVNEDDLEDIIAGLGGGFDPLRHLNNCSRRETLARMLRNLQQDFAGEGKHLKAFQARMFLRLVEGDVGRR